MNQTIIRNGYANKFLSSGQEFRVYLFAKEGRDVRSSKLALFAKNI